MKKGILKIVSAVALLAAALPCAASPVLANSGPSREYGVTSSGVIVRNENSALAVESEKLTFDIVDLPDHYGIEPEYKSTVTAEYKFVNTSSNTLHTSMAFPIKAGASYRYDYIDFKPEISVDGVPVDCTKRYSLNKYTDFDESVKFLHDEWYADDFYNPDLPVTKYTVSVDCPDGYDGVRLTGEPDCDISKARYISGVYELVYCFATEWGGSGNTVYDFDTQDDEHSFYVLGDASAFNCKWHTEAGNYRNKFSIKYKTVDVPYTITEEGTTTLKELVLSKRPKDSVINVMDYYNAAVHKLANGIYAGRIENLTIYDSDALIWYTYDVEVAPSGSITNKITVPIYPTTYYTYDPYVYEYEYYLSPAAKWASFGKLEVRVNSEYFMVKPSNGFEKCEGGYKVEYPTLPEGELTFRMSTSENPGRGSSARTAMVTGIVFLVLLCLICIVVPLAVFTPFIIKAIKKRRAEKKLDFSSKAD